MGGKYPYPGAGDIDIRTDKTFRSPGSIRMRIADKKGIHNGIPGKNSHPGFIHAIIPAIITRKIIIRIMQLLLTIRKIRGELAGIMRFEEFLKAQYTALLPPDNLHRS